MYQHSVEDCSFSEVYPWQWFAIRTRWWRLFIVCNISVTLIRCTNVVVKIVCILKKRLTLTACFGPCFCTLLQVAAVMWWLLYYRNTQNVVATNITVRHETCEPNGNQSSEYWRRAILITGIVLECRASLQPAT